MPNICQPGAAPIALNGYGGGGAGGNSSQGGGNGSPGVIKIWEYT